jgi:hypothetical protein
MLPGAELSAVAFSAVWPLIVGGMFYLMLLFPSGHQTGKVMRLLARAFPVAAAGEGAFYVVGVNRPEEPYADLQSPLAWPALHSLELLGLAFAAVLLLSAALAVLNVVARFRRSGGVEREQFRWLAFAAGTAMAGMLLSLFGSRLDWLSANVQHLGFAGFPVAVGIAILKHRLFDIDRVINRTLVYGLLTAALAVVYLGLVVGLQEALRPVSGGSDFAIVITTLIVAALFLPARRRIQEAVDRRFNRRAYDGARTVEAFGARLRQQVDLDTLRYELLSVVDETMQPAGAALWLRQK